MNLPITPEIHRYIFIYSTILCHAWLMNVWFGSVICHHSLLYQITTTSFPFTYPCYLSVGCLLWYIVTLWTHYSDATWASWSLKSPSILFIQQLPQAKKKNTKVPSYCLSEIHRRPVFHKKGQWGLHLLTWVNFNSSMDKWLHPSSSVGWNYLAIPKFQRRSL